MKKGKESFLEKVDTNISDEWFGVNPVRKLRRDISSKDESPPWRMVASGKKPRVRPARKNISNRVKIFTTVSPTQTKRLGEKIGLNLKPKTTVCLVGELGSGKTTLIQGIAHGLGIEGYITSPSFKLISEYEGRLPLYHFDLWRLEGRKDLESLGYREYFFGKGVVVIEWAEKAREVWPDQRVEIYLEYKGRRRRKIKVIDFTGEL